MMRLFLLSIFLLGAVGVQADTSYELQEKFKFKTCEIRVIEGNIPDEVLKLLASKNYSPKYLEKNRTSFGKNFHPSKEDQKKREEDVMYVSMWHFTGNFSRPIDSRGLTESFYKTILKFEVVANGKLHGFQYQGQDTGYFWVSYENALEELIERVEHLEPCAVRE